MKKGEPQFEDVSAEEKIDFFNKVIESDKDDFQNMSRDDLIYYILWMNQFLRAKKEFDATLCFKLRFGRRS